MKSLRVGWYIIYHIPILPIIYYTTIVTGRQLVKLAPAAATSGRKSRKKFVDPKKSPQGDFFWIDCSACEALLM